MQKNICIVSLPGEKNFAVISPGRVVYGLNASNEELLGLVVEEEKALSERTPSSEEYKSTPSTSIGLIPTFDCNLGCIYCYARGGETKESMNLEIAMTAISEATTEDNKEHLLISLVGGGEPLLHFNLVKQLVSYARTIYKAVDVNVVTNGTFGEETLDWLLENRVSIRVSYDGVMQGVQRPFADGSPSKSIVENNIRQLVVRGGFVIVQSIITRASINTMCETIDLVYSLGVRAIKFEPALATDVSRASRSIEPDPSEYAEALLDAISYVARCKLDLTIDTGYFAEPSTEYYCGMADSNRIVTPHGKVTSCVEVARPTDPYASEVMIGETKDGRMILDQGKRDFLSTFHYDNQLGGCPDCNLRLICHGGCPMANIWKGGLPIRKSSFTCTVERTFLPRLLLMIAEDPNVAQVVMEDGKVDRF